MFKVECPGCKAPYQVDERRVPSTGLKMRCPKCGTSFQVEPPLDPRATGPSPLLSGGAVPAVAPVAPAPLAPASAKPGLGAMRKATMLGVAAQGGAAPAAPKPAAPAPAPGLADDLDADLPAPAVRGAKPGAEPDFADFGDIGLDLPAPAAPKPAPPAPRPAAGPPKPPPPRPAPPRPPAAPKPAPPPDDLEIDLPAPVGAAQAAPPVGGGGFGEIDLPMAAESAPLDAEELDLPVVGARGGPPRAPEPARSGGGGGFDVDLPAPRGPAAPAAGGGLFGELDLPSLSAELPAVGGDLPAPSAGLAVGLPAPIAAGLPAPAAGLPSPAAGLPSPAAGLPAPAAGLPSPGGGLPSPAAGLPAYGSAPSGFGAAALGAAAGAGAAFGEVELGSPQGAAAPPPPAWGGEAPQELVRQAGGGTDFGEVNLEGGDAEAHISAGEEAEFGGPQPAARPQQIAIETAGMPRVGALPQESEPPKKKRNLRVFMAVGVLAVLGGAALALVPNVGPFGLTWAYDKAKSGEYQRMLATTASAAREALAKDTHPEARNAYQQVDKARNQAKRVRGLSAYQVYVAYARELRFGPDSEVSARAQVLLAELKEHKSKEVPNLALARAAASAVAGDVDGARGALDQLAKANPNDIDVLTLQGELELRAGDDAKALDVWNRAEQIEKSARTAYGLARARFGAGERDQAEKLARTALERSPAHAGARVLIARAIWNHGKEADATKLLGEVTSAADVASPSELVDAYTVLGDIHLARSRVTHADRAYSEALKIDPKAARALVGLGDALYRSGRHSEALARFEAGTQADPKEVTAKIGVAKALLALERIQDVTAAVQKLKLEHPDNVLVAYWFGKVLEAINKRKEAEQAYRDAIKASPKDPDITLVHIGLAQLLSAQGKQEEAEKVLTAAKAASPNSATIHVAIGELALSQGKNDNAISELQQALKIDPGEVNAKFQLGVAYRRARNFDDATKKFDEVAEVDKDYPGLALERGLLYEQSGRTAEALKAYESALAKAPNDPDLMLRVGCGKTAEGVTTEAITLLKKVLEKRPNSAEANHCLGRALLAQGSNLAEALRYAERAVDIDPNRAEYHLYVGWAANESARASRAETALAKALELDRGMGDAYWQRGVLRYRQGAVRDAVKDLQKALELKPSRVEAHAALADSYYDLGKEADALREYQLAVEARPEEATWRFRYGKLLAANRRMDDAERELGKALELVDKQDLKPRWLWEAHHLLARAMGDKKEAIPHWEEFLKAGPADSPYRAEAKKKLAELGKPWEGN